MAAINEDVKLLLVERLACFESHASIIELVKQEFKVTLTRQQLSAYDPNTVAGTRLSAEHKNHFETTRKRFLSDLSDVPLAHTAARMRFLSEIAYQARQNENFARALAACEQIAKDLGGMFEQKFDPKLLTDAQLARLFGLTPRENAGGDTSGSGAAGTDTGTAA